MKQFLAVLLLFALIGTLLADDLIETFDDPLEGWRSRWLAENTNMQNWYVVEFGHGEDFRGTNPCGIFISDGDHGNWNCTIDFDPIFGTNVSYFEIGIECFFDQTLRIYDVAGLLVDEANVLANWEDGDNGCGVALYHFDLPTGLGSFTLEGVYVEGETAIDNVKVTVETTDIEETSWSSIKALYD